MPQKQYADEQRLDNREWTLLRENNPRYFRGMNEVISYELCLHLENEPQPVRPLNLLEK